MQLQIYDRNDGRYNKKRKNSAIWNGWHARNQHCKLPQ